MSLCWLDFDYSEGDDGTGVFDAMASVTEADAAQVQAEVDGVLAWAEAQFAGRRGPMEEGGDWDSELQLSDEPGSPPRRCFSLTLAGSASFCEAFRQHFGIGAG